METENTEKREKEKKPPIESEEFKGFRESFESAKEIEDKVRLALDFMKSVLSKPEGVTLKNGRPATRGVCPGCGTKVFRIGKS